MGRGCRSTSAALAPLGLRFNGRPSRGPPTRPSEVFEGLGGLRPPGPRALTRRWASASPSGRGGTSPPLDSGSGAGMTREGAAARLDSANANAEYTPAYGSLRQPMPWSGRHGWAFVPPCRPAWVKGYRKQVAPT